MNSLCLAVVGTAWYRILWWRQVWKDVGTVGSYFPLTSLSNYLHFISLQPDISQEQPLTQNGLSWITSQLFLSSPGWSCWSGWMVERCQWQWLSQSLLPLIQNQIHLLQCWSMCFCQQSWKNNSLLLIWWNSKKLLSTVSACTVCSKGYIFYNPSIHLTM